MKTEVQIRTTQQCPSCKGEGEIYNPEWEGYAENEKVFKAANPTASPKEVNRAGDDYWEGKGYSREDIGAGLYCVPGPWDVRECDNCNGTGTEENTAWVQVSELLKS